MHVAIASRVEVDIDEGRSVGVIAVLNKADGDGYPLVMPIRPNGDGFLEVTSVMTNMILTVFGPDNFGEYFGAAVRPGHVLYADSQGMTSLSDAVGRQLFTNLANVPTDRVLGVPACLSKLDRGQQAVEDMVNTIYQAAYQRGEAVDRRSLIKPPYAL